MLLTELSATGEQTVQIESSLDLRDDLVALGAKEIKPDLWFFHDSASKKIANLMDVLSKRGVFTILQK